MGGSKAFKKLLAHKAIMMISFSKNKLKNFFWTWRQQHTRLPVCPSAVVSDLFVWRSSDQWQTAFELIDIPSLFEDAIALRNVLIIFFNKNGQYLFEKKIKLLPNRRITFDISSLVGKLYGEMGTFAVFHLETLPKIKEFGSFITERGYISYKYLDSPLRTYVHGNFDAVARCSDGRLQLLGGSSFLYRVYNLQFCFFPDHDYEIMVVNPSPVKQKFIFGIYSYITKNNISLKILNIPSGGMQLIPIRVKTMDAVRVIIKSHLVLARPLVFSFKNHKVNVFHG
jgi:hypothetical protein